MLTLVTAPAAPPVTLDEAKAQLLISGSTAHDARLTRLIGVATGAVEKATGRALAVQDWALTVDTFTYPLVIEKGPVRTVTGITYIDANGVEQSLPAGAWQVRATHFGAEILPPPGGSWPSTQYGRIEAVCVSFSAGYDPVPEELRHAILLLVTHWFENPEPVNIGNIVNALPLGVEWLLEPFTARSVA